MSIIVWTSRVHIHCIWIRIRKFAPIGIRIHQMAEYGSNWYPDPQRWLVVSILSRGKKHDSIIPNYKFWSGDPGRPAVPVPFFLSFQWQLQTKIALITPLVKSNNLWPPSRVGSWWSAAAWTKQFKNMMTTLCDQFTCTGYLLNAVDQSVYEYCY